MKEAQVIGSGLSGLATAWHLADYGFTVTVSDAAAGPGGLIQTRQSPHGLVETAANAFVWTDTVAEWFDRLDLAPVTARDESKRRYIYRDGRPRRWPLSVRESAGLAARLAPVQSFFQGRYARGRVVQEVVSEPQADATQEVTTATP